MAHIDVFNQRAFQMVSLTAAVNKMPYRPHLLGGMGIFTPNRVRTTSVSVEEKNGVLNLIAASDRGAPLNEKKADKRNLRNFNTLRLAKGSTIYADEIQSVRAFGSESELAQISDIVTDRLSGPTGLLSEIALTRENLMLGAVQGIVLDADGTTSLVNWYTEFGITQATEIDFDLDNATPASGAVRKKCNQVMRAMKKAAAGAWIDGMTYAMAICGDNFFDDLVAHEEIRKTYLNQQEAGQLRNDVGNAYESVRYGGILFVNYRGTDDGTSIAVGIDQCKFFPVDAPGVFQEAFSPAEFMPFVNTPGQNFYAMIVPDKEREAWVRPEVYSYPLPICTRPGMLQRARRT
ncbi:major capsid protein E [bacterium endosymbiont of Escarpia laminata]|nr:MAG: major capsid protein E [bacterium endosymbiont of Escarpia laminata]